MRSPWACVLLVTVAVTGCEAIFKQSGSVAPIAAHPGADADRNRGAYDGRGEVVAYLNFLDVLDSADEQGWNTIFEHTLNAYREDPTRERRLRLALVMSRADGKSAERQVTRNMLTDSRKLLDDTARDPAATPPLVRKFAQLQLTEIEHRLALYDELQSLRSQLAKAHQASQTAQRDRTEAEARIRSIDAALAEANAKLEAVMNIERKIGPTGRETFP
ncbi:MAG: hypothetical protein BMS9Abin01_1184 [Gammaproteobacteria bacterium]|nr:MAG: hypothetical protein BMS9Abin01_1184 [Gammaproteobacteria bacterium]